jgi:hypothetical protein
MFGNFTIRMRHSATAAEALLGCALTLGLSSLVTGCKTVSPANSTNEPASPTAATTQYPQRPTVAPPAFKVFHHDASSITLVTKDTASDAEIEAILWQLRDAARAHSFDKLGVPQKLVDARDPIVFFHLYRGSKCASEKYTSGALPCGASYHAAGDFTLGGFANHNRADGALLHDEDHQTELWNPDAATY